MVYTGITDHARLRLMQRSRLPLHVLTDMLGNDSNLLIVFYVQIMPDDLVMQLHRF